MSLTVLIIIIPFRTLQITAVYKYILIIFQIVCIQLTDNIREFTLLSCICGVGSLLLVPVSKLIFPKVSPSFYPTHNAFSLQNKPVNSVYSYMFCI